MSASKRAPFSDTAAGPRPTAAASGSGPPAAATPTSGRTFEPSVVASKAELFKLFLSEHDDPEPFYSKLADRSVSEFPFPLRDRRVLDVGAGPGYYSAALQRAGAWVVPIDLGAENMHKAGRAGLAATRSDAGRLPFPGGAFDGVFCSNMLEHVPEPASVLDEIERVLRPGGWGWISWTNWYSPWGGHDITPWHFLGPHLGPKVHAKLHGGPPERNPVFDGLWPTYVGAVLDDVRARPGLRVLDAMPRYYPSQRWVLRVPGLREVITWNCLIMVERVGGWPPDRPAQDPEVIDLRTSPPSVSSPAAPAGLAPTGLGGRR